MESVRILFLVENPSYYKRLLDSLMDAGFLICRSSSMEKGLNLAERIDPHIAIVDLISPLINGSHLCKALRQTNPTMGILVVDETPTPHHRIKYLTEGVDEYLDINCDPLELIARIRSILRRISLVDSRDYMEDLQVSQLYIRPSGRQVLLHGKEIKLTRLEFDLLHFLAKHQNMAMDRTLLIKEVWGATFNGDYKAVDIYIKRLRAKVETDPSHPKLIKTIRGIGYKLCSTNTS